MKKIKIISVLLLSLTLNSIPANAAVTTTKNKDGSVTITDTTTGTVTEISNDDGSPVTDEEIAEGIADNASTNTNTNTSTNATTSTAANTLKPVQNGWTQDSNGYWYYYKDSILQKGWVEYNGKWYYLEPNGMMAAYQWIDENFFIGTTAPMYYVGADGVWIPNATGDTEVEPAYGAIKLLGGRLEKYIWYWGNITFKYYNNKWNVCNYTELADLAGKTGDFKKYASVVLMPVDKGTEGEERKFGCAIYLGTKSTNYK